MIAALADPDRFSVPLPAASDMSAFVSDQRSGRRRTIAAEVQLRRSSTIRHTVQGYDLSATGCKIEFVEQS